MNVTDDLEALRVLEPVGLDEMTEDADLQTRRDRKYLVPRGVVGDLVTASDGAWRVLTIDDARSFRYESVYFDTSDFRSFLSAARRRPSRYKVRTRSYLDAGACVLEVKTRDPRGHTVKHRHPYDLDHRAELTHDGRRFVATIDQAAGAVDNLRPALTTRYRRSTLVLADSAARITIDVDLTWVRPDGCRADLLGVALVETKTLGQPCSFDRALWRSGHRPVTISKYCTGLAALCPRLPANKWHRVLRRHFDWAPAGAG